MENGYQIMRDRGRAMRRAMTPAEFRLWQSLSNRQCHGLRFLRQRVIGQFILGFYCPAKKLGIEVDGSIHALSDVRIYDCAKEEGLLEELGIVIVRFTNEEILHGNSTAWYARIQAALQTRTINPLQRGTSDQPKGSEPKRAGI
jgi:very-short-patch-repair endonuclease